MSHGWMVAVGVVIFVAAIIHFGHAASEAVLRWQRWHSECAHPRADLAEERRKFWIYAAIVAAYVLVGMAGCAGIVDTYGIG